MMRRRELPNLKSLRAFEAAARHMSFTKAADELCVTQGSISRQIQLVETYLDQLLFRRTARAVELTEAGGDYAKAVSEALDLIEAASLRLKGDKPDSVVSLSVLPTFAVRWLIPRLERFANLYPDAELRMISSIDPADFSHESIDLAVRVGLLPNSYPDGRKPRIDLQMVADWAGIQAIPLMPDVMIAVCSPALLAGRDPGSIAPTDLRAYPFIHTSTRGSAWPDWFAALGLDYTDRPEDLHYGHFFMALQAALNGRGIALVPNAFVEEDLASGALVRLIERDVESAGHYYLLRRTDAGRNPAIARFVEWITAEAAA